MTQRDSPPPPWGDRRLTLEQLRVFVAIAETEGLRRAGESLGRTQSAMTHTLRRLEQIVGCRLIDRRQGQVLGLTGEGRRLLGPARDLLARSALAVTALRHPALSGRVRLGLPDDFAPAELSGAIARCLDHSPGLRVETESALSADLFQRFARRDLDVALVNSIAPQTPPGAIRHRLRHDRLYWVHRRPIRRDPGGALPLVAFPPGCPFRAVATDHLTALDQPSYFAFVSPSYETVRAAISAGLGVGVLPAAAIAADHVRLPPELGFPALPAAELSVLVWPGDGLAERFAAAILPNGETVAERITPDGSARSAFCPPPA